VKIDRAAWLVLIPLIIILASWRSQTKKVHRQRKKALEDISSIDQGQVAGEPDAPTISINSSPTPDYNKSGPHKRKHSWVECFAILIAAMAFFASAWQGWVARDTERHSLRAYLGADYGSFRLSCVGCNKDEAKRTYGTRVGYFLKNFGLTPAQHVTICSYAFYSGDVVTKKDVGDAIAGCGQRPPIFQSTVYPGEAIPYFGPIAPEPAISAQRYILHLHIIIHIQYVDVLGDPRETWVCKTYYFSGQDFFVGCLTDAMPFDN
jgi:hypothetical protein